MADENMLCDDFQQFQDIIKTMRMIDDKIIYALNTTVPTASFKGNTDATNTCKALYSDLNSSYQGRGNAIKKCISHVSRKVATLRENKSKNPDNFDVNKNLRKEQTVLRLLQSELVVEDVIKERSINIFNERCRNYYTIPHL